MTEITLTTFWSPDSTPRVRFTIAQQFRWIECRYIAAVAHIAITHRDLLQFLTTATNAVSRADSQPDFDRGNCNEIDGIQRFTKNTYLTPFFKDLIIIESLLGEVLKSGQLFVGVAPYVDAVTSRRLRRPKMPNCVARGF